MKPPTNGGTNSNVDQAWGVLEAEMENYELARELFKEGLKQCSDNTYIIQVTEKHRCCLEDSQYPRNDFCFASLGIQSIS